MGKELYETLRRFFAEHPAAVAAARPLADGANSRVELEGDDTIYTLIREEGRSVLRPGEPEDPDLSFYFTRAAVHYITEGEGTIGDFGKRLYHCVFGGDPACRVEFRPTTSIRTFYRRGYFGILRLAGPEVSRMIMRHVMRFITSRGKAW